MYVTGVKDVRLVCTINELQDASEEAIDLSLPLPRNLLESTKGFKKSAYKVRATRITKPSRYLYKNFFVKITFEEHCHDIHLVTFKIDQVHQT